MRSLFAPIACLGLLLGPGCDPPPQHGTIDAVPPPPIDAGPPEADAGNRSGVGSLELVVTDDETGLTLPSRVLITAVPPTPPIRFDVNARGMVLNGETAASVAPGVMGAPEGVMLYSGAGSMRIPAGTYELFITHGPEWEADTRKVTIGPRDTIRIESALRHSVDTAGWLAADLHVHTARSYDSQLQLDARVISEVAVGVQLIVTTDHNIVTDLQPLIEVLGYRDVARAIVGDEFNFFEGHGGAYPMMYDARNPDAGITKFQLDWDTVRLIHGPDMFDYLHKLPSSPAVTINHPRLLPDLGYFINLRWSPPEPLLGAGKFDALEVLNGYLQAPEDARALMRDWFFLLTSGYKVTALGSSDTHRLRDVKAGFPRTWLRLPTDDVTRVLDSELGDAIKHQRAIASTGPFATLTVDGAKIGEQVTNPTGTVIIEATVDAPAWIDVDKIRLYVNGKLVEERSVAPGLRPLFHAKWPQALPPGDCWVVLQASGSKPLPVGLIGDHEAGRVMPFVITSPVFVDGDGDHKWKPMLADPRDADPGPLGPVTGPSPGDALELLPPQSQPAPEDCEPPLWTNPSTWVNP